MKTKIILSVFSAVVAVIFLSAYTRSDSNSPCDAPLVGDHTGAPGETDCTGCHLGTNNSGPGTVIFDVGGGITQYVPGQTYLCTVTITQTGIDKMGYACTALRNSNNSAAGIFSLTEPMRTRLFTSGGRNYCSHNPCGADASVIGTNSWTFNWLAPSANVGNITLYIGALATNHNHATTGDNAYTRTVTLTPSPTSVSELSAGSSGLEIYPNPVTSTITLVSENLFQNAALKIYNALGERVEPNTVSIEPGKIEADVSSLPAGMYFLSVCSDKKIYSQKIFKE